MRRLVAILPLACTLVACADTTTSPTPATSLRAAPRATLVPGVPGELSSAFTVTGDLTEGNTVNLVLSVTNRGTEAYADTVFGEVFIPAIAKRQIDLQLTEPRIQCETYRGTHGGLAANVYSDVCRIWFFNGLTAGATKQATIPIKLLTTGDGKPWEFVQAKQFGRYTTIDSASIAMHVNPKSAGGGGGGKRGGG